MLTNPSIALNAIGMVASSMVDMAAQMASQFATMFAAQIQRAIGQVLGTAIALLSALYNIANAIENLYNNLKSLWQTIKDKVSKWEGYRKSDEECACMFAAIAACYLNKLIGDDIQEFYEDVSGAINDWGNELNSAVADTLSSTQTMTNYINQDTYYLNKMSTQVSQLNTMVYGIK